ncbi:MAG: hydroxymethylbilane synthase [candidate division Zixibacteria bacterium]|jgi:hydroxymethylbilane synthase|nr:hydroxymethylbilane synthase [candidate division Zixibacteria bacterium]
MAVESIRVGTRASRLAVTQALWVTAHLQQMHPAIDFRLIRISTSGDEERLQPLEQMGGIGVFTKRIEQALIDNEIDLAVHSAKDLPSVMTSGLVLAAVPEREERADVWLSRDARRLDDTPHGAVVGTSSPRRRALLLSMRPDLSVRDIRGNVETRLEKLHAGDYDALIMAAAGLSRLDMEQFVTHRLPTDKFVPAGGQGALAVQCRANDHAVIGVARTIDCEADHQCVDAERRLMEKLGAGCSAAVGCTAMVSGSDIRMIAAVLDKRGVNRLQVSQTDTVANRFDLAERLAGELIAQGAKDLLE